MHHYFSCRKWRWEVGGGRGEWAGRWSGRCEGGWGGNCKNPRQTLSSIVRSAFFSFLWKIHRYSVTGNTVLFLFFIHARNPEEELLPRKRRTQGPSFLSLEIEHLPFRAERTPSRKR